MAERQYRCYLTDADDRIKSVQVITCSDDAEAMLQAEGLLTSSALMIAELWQGARLVGKWGKGQQPTKEHVEPVASNDGREGRSA